MAVTKQTYTATATWTASQLASIFQSAFIDAGLMTDWHDSFLSGSIENRVLRVVYDGAKTYGTTFYWFMFSTSGVFVHVATGWDTSTKVPTGTQYLDYFSTTTNSTANHWALLSTTSSTTVDLVRYTSAANTNQTWFVVKSGAVRRTFTITNGASPLQSWLNLNLGFYSGFAHASFSTTSQMGLARFRRGPALRRELTLGCGLVGNTSSGNYTDFVASQDLSGYAGIGNLSNSINNYNLGAPNVFLPIGFSSTNPAYASNSNPVFHSLPHTPYTVNPLPSDFGISFHYATNSFSLGDTFVVSSGVEEWEVLDFSNGTSAITTASPIFLARVI